VCIHLIRRAVRIFSIIRILVSRSLLKLCNLTHHHFNTLFTVLQMQVFVKSSANADAHLLQVARREMRAFLGAKVATSKACFQSVRVDDLAFPPANNSATSKKNHAGSDAVYRVVVRLVGLSKNVILFAGRIAIHHQYLPLEALQRCTRNLQSLKLKDSFSCHRHSISTERVRPHSMEDENTVKEHRIGGRLKRKEVLLSSNSRISERTWDRRNGYICSWSAGGGGSLSASTLDQYFAWQP